MNKSNINALIRELRNEAQTLPAGKKRDVLSKLDRIDLHFRRAGAKTPANNEVTEDEAERFSSQAKTIYNYLLAGNTLTSMDALRIFGVARLASRICDIEKQTGITPNRRRIQVVNRFGKEVYVNEYWIEQGE
jgi:hypothetical protein